MLGSATYMHHAQRGVHTPVIMQGVFPTKLCNCADHLYRRVALLKGACDPDNASAESIINTTTFSTPASILWTVPVQSALTGIYDDVSTSSVQHQPSPVFIFYLPSISWRTHTPTSCHFPMRRSGHQLRRHHPRLYQMR